MKLSIFAILLLSLSACQKDCITKSSGKKNNISPIDSNEQNETDNIKNNANQIPLDKAVKNDIKVILQNKAVDNNPPATDNNPPAIDDNLGYSAEEKAHYDEILKKPNSEEFINLLKSSLNTFNKKLEHPAMGDNGLDTEEKYIKATQDFSEEEKKLASQKKYLQEHLLVILTEKFAANEITNKDLFTQVTSKDLLMAAKESDVIKGNIFKYIDNLDKNSAELPKIIDIEFMNRSANKEITKEVIDKLLTKNSALDVKELFNKLSSTSPTDAKDILAVMLQKGKLDLVDQSNFNQLINGGVDKDLIYKNIRPENIYVIKEIIKKQNNKELLTEILSKFNNLEIDDSLINNFGNKDKDNNYKDQELLKLVWNKAQSEGSKISYNLLSKDTIKSLLNILDEDQRSVLVKSLNDEKLKKVVDEWIVSKFTVLINRFLSTSQVYINNQTQEKPLANINDNFNNLFKQEELNKLLSMATDKKTIRDELFNEFENHVKFDSTKNLKAKIDELLNTIHPPA